MPGRLAAVAAATAALLGLTATAAVAAWTASASGQRQISAATVEPPVTASATALDWSSTRVSWQAPTTGAPPSAYRVVRVAPSAVVCEQAAPPCTDTGLNGSTSYGYRVFSRVGDHWVSAGSAQATTTTPLDGSFTVTAASTAVAGTSYAVTIQARRSGGTVDDTAYTGSRTLAWSGTAAQASPGGTAATLPTTATFDAAGRAVVTVTLTRANASAVLTVSDPAGRTASHTLTVSPAVVPLVLTCPASGRKTQTVSITIARPLLDGFGNATPDAAVALTVVGGTWPGNPATATPLTRSVTLTAATPSQALTLGLTDAQPRTATVTTDAPPGYSATSCVVQKLD